MFDPAQFIKWNRPVPRYTSYPTAPQFQKIEEGVYEDKLTQFAARNKPLSLYIHIPFCRSMCLFCGCSVVLNRSLDRHKTYLSHLLQEIALVSKRLGKKQIVSQLHLGGGTPTSLSEAEFEELMGALRNAFVFSLQAEISIEVDPRTVFTDQGKKLRHLRELGFNRISFGVQDLDPEVQEAVKRRQSEEMTVQTYRWARELAFDGISIDLIYGLPLQTPEKFRKTAEKILELKPDRIAFFSYAKIPWLKPHQKAIPDELLPSTEDKFKIYVETRNQFLAGGYVGIGMDHFALSHDPLSKAIGSDQLMRNFQGYSLKLAEDLIGFGITSIGFIENSYFQNIKKLDEYGSMLENESLPVEKGLVLSEEDLKRRWVIESLMCHFKVDKEKFFKKFQVPFDTHFLLEKAQLEALEKEGLLEESEASLVLTPMGQLVSRIAASVFDAYVQKGQFSKAI